MKMMMHLYIVITIISVLVFPTLAKLPSSQPPSSGYGRSSAGSLNNDDSDETTTRIGQSKASNAIDRRSFDDSPTSRTNNVVDSIHSPSSFQRADDSLSSSEKAPTFDQQPYFNNRAYNSLGLQYSNTNTVGVNGNAGPGMNAAAAAAASGGNPLMRKMSSASLSGLFLFMAWRDIACYEMSNLFESPFLRLFASGSTIGLLLLNLVGFCLNLIQPFKYKAHLKVILAANTMREMIEIAYYVLMFIISPGGGLHTSTSSSLSPAFEDVHGDSKDTYLGRFITTLYFLLLCLSATRMRWVKDPIQPTAINSNPAPVPRATYVPRSYDDTDEDGHDDGSGYSNNNKLNTF